MHFWKFLYEVDVVVLALGSELNEIIKDACGGIESKLNVIL